MGLKVLHLIDSGGLYGAEKVLLILAAEQLKQGLSPLILSAGTAREEEKAIETEAKKLGIPVKHWCMRSGLNLSAARRIMQWADANGFTIAHSHGYKFNILLGLLPKPLRKLRFVSTVHGYTATHRASKLGLYQKIDRYALRQADAVVLVAASNQSTFSGLRSVYVIPNGIPAQPAAAERQLVPPPAQVYIVGVGRLSEEKAFHRLLSAFASLVEVQGIAVDLVIAGDGPKRNELEMQALRLGIGSRVHFAGFVEDASSLIRQARVLVIPSSTEGLPLVLLEAMRAGTPIVSTPVGGIPRVLGSGKYGYLARDLSWQSLASVLVDCLDNKDEARVKAELAKQEFDLHYHSAAMAEAYTAVYRRFALS